MTLSSTCCRDYLRRITFFDFSSAFNTIHPSLLRVKLERAGPVTSWLHGSPNYLTDRPQFVRLQDCVSDVVVCSTGAPQGTVLSPFLFTLYTSDFTYSTDSCHLQKFSDDTAIVGCVSERNDCEYRKVIMDFVDWCELNHLQVNASKTKEMDDRLQQETLGIERTTDLLCSRFYRPKMVAEVEAKVKTFDQCIQRKTPPQKAAELVNIQVTRPLELVCMDFLTTEPDRSNTTNVLVITDHYTMYAVAVPTPNQKARTMAKRTRFIHEGIATAVIVNRDSLVLDCLKKTHQASTKRFRKSFYTQNYQDPK
ncbi:hypothetical protein L3Q82_004233 [Scortum barcoo]|uniref:Uncharacterized protein n=1 Tax=Scortum barcoo TaxID=214431 RepID=A0ACB8VK49_9TELE|nr:hypothetical protein L3Q82_004233 [Scortum barcoo]